VIGKRLDQRPATIVVAGDQVVGAVERAESLAQRRVGFAFPVVRQVPRYQHHVRRVESVPQDKGLELCVVSIWFPSFWPSGSTWVSVSCAMIICFPEVAITSRRVSRRAYGRRTAQPRYRKAEQ
jgi:hypothetical protein